MRRGVAVLAAAEAALAATAAAAHELRVIASGPEHGNNALMRRRLEGNSSQGYNFMFYFVIGAMMLTCLIYNIFFKRKMEAGFMRQQALPETMLRQDVIARCVEGRSESGAAKD